MIPVSNYFNMSLILDEGKKGSVELKLEIMPEGHRTRMYDAVQGMFYFDDLDDEFITVILKEGPRTWMSDTPMEQESLYQVMKKANGDVLIGGLGIGLLPTLLSIADNSVKNITVVEANEDVIDLVWPQLKPYIDIEVVNMRIEEFLESTESRYDFVYIDIWEHILGPIQDIETAREAYQKLLKPDGELRIWLQELYDRVASSLPTEPTNSGGLVRTPCIVCGKTLRHDYAGLCMDCADTLNVSEMFLRR